MIIYCVNMITHTMPPTKCYTKEVWGSIAIYFRMFAYKSIDSDGLILKASLFYVRPGYRGMTVADISQLVQIDILDTFG